MEGYILLSILAFAFSAGAICASAATFCILKYNIFKMQMELENSTNAKLKEQADYLIQKAQEDAYIMIKESVQSNLDQRDSMSIGNFNNIGL